MKHHLKWRLAALAVASAAFVLSMFPVAPAAAGVDDWPPSPGYGSAYGCYHVVRYGETMSGIAGQYGTSVYNLMQANGMQSPNRIYAGMSMGVPCAPIGYSYRTPYSNQYSMPYSSQYPAPYSNQYRTPYSNQCIAAYYRVQFGDNLFRIGLRYGMNVNTLAYANGLANPNLIYAGMTLVIPCSMGYPSQPYLAPIYPPQPYPAPIYPPQPYPTPVYPPAPYMTPMPMPTQPAPGQVMVVMQNIAFSPATITIRAGQTVVWRNDDSTQHTTTSGMCPNGVCSPMAGWDSGILNPGQSFAHLFSAAGTFPYYCRIHGAMMQGTVVVTP